MVKCEAPFTAKKLSTAMLARTVDRSRICTVILRQLLILGSFITTDKRDGLLSAIAQYFWSPET